jgi:hypothetical protein
MAQEVHYEIFSRQGAPGSWRMLDARDEREQAISFAKSLLADQRAAGVKVVKETYNSETGDYLTLKIFEDGHNKLKIPPAEEDVPHALPCFKPDDLYSYHARITISRLLGEYLARNRLTLTELSHRADALEKLEATGTLLQHAIQKVAVAQASSTKAPVHEIIRTLNELVNKAFQRVYRDHRRNYFPQTDPSGFSTLAAKLHNQPDGPYVLNAAIARYLQETAGWDEKVQRLIGLMEIAQGDGRALLLSSIDTIIAEILGGSSALRDLIGVQEDFSRELSSLVELFLGNDVPGGDGRNGLIALTHHFAADDLPEARAAIARRLMAEFKSMKRLRPSSLGEEFETLRKIADRLVRGLGKYLSHEDLMDAFTLRSRRLVTPETLSEHLADSTGADEKLDRLLAVEQNIVGAENKRKLATFTKYIITELGFETHFQNPRVPALSQLQTLANLQLRVLRSGYQENQRREIAERLDKVAGAVEARARLLDSVVAHAPTPVECANRLLKLCTGNFLTEGQLSRRARSLVLEQLAKPGFLLGYTAQIAREGESLDPASAPRPG